LLSGERLGGAQDHVPGVVHDHIQPAALGEDPVDGGVGGVLRRDVQLDSLYVDLVVGAVARQVGHRGRVTGRHLADARVHGVPGEGQRTHGQRPNAAGGPGDQDGLSGAVVPHDRAFR